MDYIPVEVFIEIPKDSNIKYELNKETQVLEVDRTLPPNFFYPYAYGFIHDTLAPDGDALDALIISNKPLENNKTYRCYIIAGLEMEDEQGEDNKMLCVLENDYNRHMNMSSIGDSVLDKIEHFFQNYKKDIPGKWSKVTRFLKKDNAYEYYYYTKTLYLNPILPDVD